MSKILQQAGVKVDYRTLDWELTTWTERDPDKKYPTQVSQILAAAKQHSIPVYHLKYDEEADCMRPGSLLQQA
jgi:hypothetical protein